MTLFRFGLRVRSRGNLLARVWAVGILSGLGGLLATRPAQAERPEAIPGGSMMGGTGSLPWTDSNCNGCHVPSATFSHPVNVRANMQVPSSLPLQNGTMTCVTCHDDSSSALHSQARASGDPMLRGGIASSAGLCVQCHERTFAGSRDAHAMGVGKAHLQWERRGPHENPRPAMSRGGFERIDAESQGCLECHDGSTATKVGERRTGDLFEHGSRQEHPIGVSYKARKGRDAIPLKPVQSLDKRVRLFDGTVGCGSCHSVFSQHDGLLVMSNMRSALCLSCHDY
ncbi:MAG: hypothetical protein KJZ65_12915 [Phycisphaerales bacterium]|nr:hypothetical protein [Phycisphaerales bacterium]